MLGFATKGQREIGIRLLRVVVGPHFVEIHVHRFPTVVEMVLFIGVCQGDQAERKKKERKQEIERRMKKTEIQKLREDRPAGNQARSQVFRGT